MEIKEVRRARLREWFTDHPIPEREKSYLSQLLNGKTSFGERAARRIERTYGMRDHWLDSVGIDAPSEDFAGIDDIPLLSWSQAGEWDRICSTPARRSLNKLPTTYRASRRTYALRVRDDSMEPKFPEGSHLIIEPDETPRPGQFVIVREPGTVEATFKQLVLDGDRRYLKPLNSRYPVIALPPTAAFCGVVKRVEMDV